jgi:hypothetical protein
VLLSAVCCLQYQEEVIGQMWQTYTALKGLIEQKDTVINNLYSQLSESQEKLRCLQNGTDAGHASGLFQTTALIKKAGGTIPNEQDVRLIADREFNNADQDGDGLISRAEWRQWMADKHNLIQEHNQVKAMLMEEVKLLRKSMNPQSQQAFDELKRSEEIRHRVEEELVRMQIANDTLRDDVATIAMRLKETEQEKSMWESDWNEKWAAAQHELQDTKQRLAAREEELEALKAKQAAVEAAAQAQAEAQAQAQHAPSTPARGGELFGHGHPHGYAGFSPMYFPSYSAPRGVSLNPYAYNVPEDRLVVSQGPPPVEGGHSYGHGLADGTTGADGGAGHFFGEYGALDLHTIANSDVAENAGGAGGGLPPTPQQQQPPSAAAGMYTTTPMMGHPAMLLLQQQQFLIQQQQQQLQLLASSSSVASSHHRDGVSASTPAPSSGGGAAASTAVHHATTSPASQTLDALAAATAGSSSSSARHHYTAATPPPTAHGYGGAADDAHDASSAPYEFRSPDDDDEYMRQSFLQHQHQHQQHHPHAQHAHAHQQQHQHQHQHLDEMYNEAKGGDGHFDHHQHQHHQPQQQYAPLSSHHHHQQQQQHATPTTTSATAATPTTLARHLASSSGSYASAGNGVGGASYGAAASPGMYSGVARSMDHPLRNALRNEVRHKNNPIALVNVGYPAAGTSLSASLNRRAAGTRRSPSGDVSPERLRAVSPPTTAMASTATNAKTPTHSNPSAAAAAVAFTTPSYAAPIARRTPSSAAATGAAVAGNSMTPRTPSAVDDGRVGGLPGGGSGRAGSPSRFMQGTNSWKKKAIATDRSAQENIIMRASTWR